MKPSPLIFAPSLSLPCSALGFLFLIPGCYESDIIASDCGLNCAEVTSPSLRSPEPAAAESEPSGQVGATGLAGASAQASDPAIKCETDRLTNAGFEEATDGKWRGDGHQIVDAAVIAPREGKSALQFLSTSGPNGSAKWVKSQLVQPIDLSDLSVSIKAGLVTAKLKAHFFRSLGTIDSAFGLGITAVKPEDPNDPTSKNVDIDFAFNSIITEEGTWTTAIVDYILPPDTTSIVVAIEARENNMNDTVDEFGGHFADDVQLEICTTAPADAK